jgi:hypothetical protein
MKARLLTAVLIAAALCGQLNAQGLVKSEDGLYMTKEVDSTVAMTKGQMLVINAANMLGGKIFVTAGGSACKYSFKKVLKTPSRVEAAEYAGLITVEVERQRDKVIFNLRAPARAPWSGTNNAGRLDIYIKIPENSGVRINTSYFDIDGVGPFSEFSVTETLNKVDVRTVRGPVDVRVSNRPLTIKDVRGSVFATNQYGSIRLENIDTGDEMATIRNEHGEISIDMFRGGCDLRNSYDRIVAQRLYLTGSKNRIKNVSGLITLEFDSLSTGKLRVNNSYSPISVNINNRVDAEFICKTDEGSRVIADHMDMTPTLVYDTRLEFETGDAAAEVRLTATGSGDINIVGPGTKGENPSR